MKKVQAIIRPDKLRDVKSILEEVGCNGMTVYEVKGMGRQGGKTDMYRGAEYDVSFQPKLMVEVVAGDELAERAVKAIGHAARTDNGIGAGKIFVTPILDVIRIRTGESGEEVL